MPDPGQVYYLPPELGEGPSKGDRPHLAVSLCPPGSDAATFAYGSTRNTDALHGAAHVRVDPAAVIHRGSGLSRPTYFYPSRLLTYAVEDLPPAAGRVASVLPMMRRELRRALGIGRGVTRDGNHRGANRRGRIALYAPWLADELGTARCLVVTDPTYSRAAMQQTTIPILGADEYQAVAGDVLVDGTEWSGSEEHSGPPVLLAVPMITSVYERDSLAAYSASVASERTMRRIDSALCSRFGL
jgi:hypothetical protein